MYNTQIEPELCWQPALRTSYLRAGTAGDPVLLLHGWGAFKELWWSTLLALAPRYRAFALDMPGHGETPVVRRQHMRDLAEEIAAFCDAEGLERVVLVGHSMGGNIALEIALLRPELVHKLVLVDAAADAQMLPRYVRLYLNKDIGWATLRLSQLLRTAFLPIGTRVPHLHGSGIVLPFLRRSAYAVRHDMGALQNLLVALYDNPLSERAAQVTVPTLVVTGQFDNLVPPAEARRVAKRIPGAQFAVVPGAMHNPMDERPAAFERILLAFLAQDE